MALEQQNASEQLRYGHFRTRRAAVGTKVMCAKLSAGCSKFGLQLPILGHTRSLSPSDASSNFLPASHVRPRRPVLGQAPIPLSGNGPNLQTLCAFLSACSCRRRTLDVAQVTMALVMAPLRRRAHDMWAECFNLKRRTALAKIPMYLMWSMAPNIRFLYLAGHVTRLDENRQVRRVMYNRTLRERRMRHALIGDCGDPRHPLRQRRRGVRPCKSEQPRGWAVQRYRSGQDVPPCERIPADCWEVAQDRGRLQQVVLSASP